MVEWFWWFGLEDLLEENEDQQKEGDENGNGPD